MKAKPVKKTILKKANNTFAAEAKAILANAGKAKKMSQLASPTRKPK